MANRDEDDVNPFAAPQADLVSRENDNHPDDGERGHQVIDAGEVITASWEIFKSNFGIAVGGVLVAIILMNLCSLPQNILNGVATAMEGQGDRDAALICRLIGLCCLPITLGGQIFFQAGQGRLLLNIAQGKNAQLGDLFTGARYFWRLLGCSILFGLMIFLGIVALIIPGIILALMFCSYLYVLIDQDAPGIESLSLARAASKDNLVALLVISLASMGINMLGMMACCVGLFVTVPLGSLFFAVAYCKMTGQRTAESM